MLADEDSHMHEVRTEAGVAFLIKQGDWMERFYELYAKYGTCEKSCIIAVASRGLDRLITFHSYVLAFCTQ